MALEIATYLPEQVLTNEEIASWRIPTNSGKLLSSEDILSRTGVKLRHLASTSETVLDMAIEVTGELDSQRLSGVDFVFFVTSYPNGVDNAGKLCEHFCLNPYAYFNVHAACSGFTFSLSHIEQNMERFSHKDILVIASEKYSPTLPDLQSGQVDTNFSQTIFSDGAAALIFRVNKDLMLLSSLNLQLPDEVSASLRMPIDSKLVCQPALTVSCPSSEDSYFRMDGKEVYVAIRNEVPPLILAALNEANLEKEDIKLVIPHQASRHILDALNKRLPSLSFYQDLQEGNLSSASIPKAMGKAVAEGLIKKRDRFVLAGFGAGLFVSIVVAEFG